MFMSAVALVEKGKWTDAVSYMARFVPDPLALNVGGRTLVLFLFLHMDIASTGQEMTTHVAKWPEHLILNVDNKILDHPTMKLRAIFLQLYSSHQVMASLDWVKVRRKAVKICQDYHVRQQPGSQILLYQDYHVKQQPSSHVNLFKLVAPSDASVVL
ncbi:hypothetical protein E2562_016870 [Oryza meyeriana var. granulata]|uniref:Uncharacterized protein n=1 Tax=Oryza meyeriana var. granulata TaxID=110450 RepID=A0A6G1BY41_9ORYZ|nr:hypothetical protein E2562_016870 [Oryza meyeriana var. granulata]